MAWEKSACLQNTALPLLEPVRLGLSATSCPLGMCSSGHCVLRVRRPCSVDEVIEAVVEGESNRLLGEIHVALLRLLQADMEESHATGAIQVDPHPLPGTLVNFVTICGQ